METNKTNDPDVNEIKSKILTETQRKERECWALVLSTEAGRRVMWDLMQKFGLFEYCFKTNSANMAEYAARQGCAQYIRNQINFYFGGVVWAQMERESMDRETHNASELERQTKELDKKRLKV